MICRMPERDGELVNTVEADVLNGQLASLSRPAISNPEIVTIQ